MPEVDHDKLWKEVLETIFKTAEELQVMDGKFEEKVFRELKRKYKIEYWNKKIKK